MLTLAFALVPAWFALVTYREARLKDSKLYETTTQVLSEQLQRSMERYVYFLVVMRNQSHNLDGASLAGGRMTTAGFAWREQLPHLISFAYLERIDGKAVVRWRSEERVPVINVGDDLAEDPRIAAAMKLEKSQGHLATMGCMLDNHRMLILLAVDGPAPANATRGYIAGWIDLDSLCRDAALPLIKDRALEARPLREDETTPAGAKRAIIRDGGAKWEVGITRGAQFGEQISKPTPWLVFIAIALSTVPLVILATLASRASGLKVALAAEQEVVRQQRYFTQSVSHEFRTPLGIILSGADLLESYSGKLSPERQSEVLAEIKDNTRHMNEMIERVLMLGRIESSGLSCNPKPVNVRKFCEELAGKVLKSAAHDCKPVAIDAPDCEAMLDTTVLGSALGNLLSNALKYSSTEKAVTLKVIRDKSKIAFVVADHGIGIPARDLQRVCDPFHRCGNVGEVPGTGLGLAIAQRCAVLHGGTLKIESVEGQGTIATIMIPTA